jgi:hypothetical protein
MVADLPDEQTSDSRYNVTEDQKFLYEYVLSSSWDVVSEVVTLSLKKLMARGGLQRETCRKRCYAPYGAFSPIWGMVYTENS